MQRDFWSLILACGFGAFVGAFVSLEIAEYFQYGRYFWGLGVIIGGLFGYVSVDPSELRSGVALAYKRTIAWRPDGLYWKTFFLSFLEFIGLCLNSVVVFCFISGDHFLMIFAMVLVVSTGSSFLYASEIMTTGSRHYNSRKYFMERNEDSKRNLLVFNPFSIFLYWPARGLWWLMNHVPSAVIAAPSTSTKVARAIGQFAATAFRYVHSRRRTICFGCAALGAAVGYQAGSAVIGAGVGATLGAVEHELVAIHWLKVVPNGGRA